MTTDPTRRDPYDDFPGRIGRTFAESEPSWPPRTAPGEKAPNIVVVLVDDMGYSDIGPFGSEIATPTLDTLADEGVRLTNYHTMPLCSPARAALLTGLDPHRVGYSTVANSDPGFPGYGMEIADDIPTVAELLHDSGYATYAVGKWHLVRDSASNAADDRDNWPLNKGFDQYYGVLEGLTSLFHPHQLVRDNSPLDIDEFADDYYYTDDITDQAISMVKSLRAHDPDKPFFLYLAHNAVHGPLQAKAEDIARHKGRYDEGWDVLREKRFAAQLAAGLLPPGTELPERNSEAGLDVPARDSLTEEQQRLYARYMEVYAELVDNIDRTWPGSPTPSKRSANSTTPSSSSPPTTAAPARAAPKAPAPTSAASSTTPPSPATGPPTSTATRNSSAAGAAWSTTRAAGAWPPTPPSGSTRGTRTPAWSARPSGAGSPSRSRTASASPPCSPTPATPPPTPSSTAKGVVGGLGGGRPAQRGLRAPRRQRRARPPQPLRATADPPADPAARHTGAGALPLLPAGLPALLRDHRRHRRDGGGGARLPRRPGWRLQPVRRGGAAAPRVQRVRRPARDGRGPARTGRACRRPRRRGGEGLRWSFTVSVDGEVRATPPSVHQLIGMAPFQGISVGVDRKSPVSWPLFERHRSFRYGGVLRSVTYTPGEPGPDTPEAVAAALKQAAAAFD